jgi:hypothetical protein
MLRIKNAKSMDDLRECQAEIDYDIWEEMEWTLVKKDLNRVKNYMHYKTCELGKTNGR